MTNDEEETYEPSFFKRLWKLGPNRIILSYDILAGVVALSGLYIYTEGGLSEAAAESMLSSFAAVSATLFAIVLTGLTIITSFTDRLFLYAWQEVEEFENIITTFQYNLGLPVVVLLITLALQVVYHPLAMLGLIALFVYMLFSLLDLVALISRYSLQRGEFVRQLVERSLEEREVKHEEQTADLSDEELLRVRQHLAELEEQKDQ